MRIALVIPYFGTFSNYFQLFLHSCALNGDQYDWLFFTDDQTLYDYPQNAKVYYRTFKEMQQYVQSKFDFPVSLTNPYKFCDYRPAYGYIFEEFLKGYDFWGHCDIDCIFGRLSDFIKDDILHYDKILRLGHLTLYRNTTNNNKRFLLPVQGHERYREVFTAEANCIFDEDNAGGALCIEDIWREYHFSEYCIDDMIANTHYKSNMFILSFQEERSIYRREKRKRAIFYWSDGKLLRLFIKNGVLCEQEFAYIHLMRRRMKNCVPASWNGAFKIIPNSFEAVEEPADSVGSFRKEAWIHPNLQYFKTRFRNLQDKLKKLRERHKKTADNEIDQQ